MAEIHIDNTHSNLAKSNMQGSSDSNKWKLEFPSLGLGVISTFLLIVVIFAGLNTALFTRSFYPDYAIALTLVQELLFLAFLLKFGGTAKAIKVKHAKET